MEVKYILDSGVIAQHEIKYNDNIPDILNELYITLGYNKNLHIDNWVIMSLEEVKDYNNELANMNIHDVYDFAYSYLGLGWVMIAAIDLKTQQVFIRRDGGSNGYNCEHNMNKMKKYRENANQKKYDSKYLTIEEFFSKLKDQKQYVDSFQEYILW